MRSPRVIVLAAALVCSAATGGGAAAAAEPAFDFARSVGLFGEPRGQGLVADLGDTTLATGDTLALVTRFERYSECASHEGLHFAIWEGVEPWRGEPLADIYHYFPFDLEPNCPGMESDTGEAPQEPDSSLAAPTASPR